MGALIFDFDGVIADSEALANLVLAEFVTELGSPTTLDDALARYSGRRFADVVGEIEKHVGRPVPDDFGEALLAATLERFRSELREVAGVKDFIRAFQHMPRCIASSSSPERLRVSLEVLGLAGTFEDAVFSAEMVRRGKPHPDLFLLAANRLGAAPGDCLVIEDSVSGIVAALNAGMASVGLCAASHVRSGHEARLRDAGATFCASSWEDVHEIATTFFFSDRR